jgi:hypothetical protein
MAYPGHSQCSAQTKSSAGVPFTSQIVGHLFEKDGKFYMQDCDGNEMPLGLVMRQYAGKHVCMNFNNLILTNGNWTVERHYDGK